MKLKWELADSSVVEAVISNLGKLEIAVNGRQVHSSRSFRMKQDVSVALPGGGQGVISVRPQWSTGRSEVSLRINGDLMLATGKEPIKCPACGAVAKPNDRFCGSCGHAMPTAENQERARHVKEAVGVIQTLAILFVIAGVLMFFLIQHQDAPALAKLATMDPASKFPTPINGVIYTVAELRDKIAFEPWSVLIVNFVLAGVMVLLTLWGKRSALPAVLVATATYAAVVGTNAVIAPQSIGQGLIVKIIVIGLLVKGIKAGLALRTANA